LIVGSLIRISSFTASRISKAVSPSTKRTSPPQLREFSRYLFKNTFSNWGKHMKGSPTKSDGSLVGKISVTKSVSDEIGTIKQLIFYERR
jgi:hypothetical protein